MNERISKETEIREVMKWQLLIAGAVDVAIRGQKPISGTWSCPASGQKGGIEIKGIKTGHEIRAPCGMEMWITGYGIMDNSIHSTWKSQSAAFPRPANRVTHNPMR